MTTAPVSKEATGEGRPKRRRGGGVCLRLVDWLRIRQLRDDGPFTSTRQAECLNPARVAAAGPVTGPPTHVSLTTDQPGFHSLHGQYSNGIIQAPNACVLGAYGSGKSAWVKCSYVLKPVATGARVLVFDKKRQHQDGADSGEYGRAVEILGGVKIPLDRRPGLGAVINILDPAIVAVGAEDSMVGQDELLSMAAEVACGGRLVDTADSAPAHALRVAHEAARRRAAAERRVAVLQDVIDALFSPDPEGVPGPVDADGRKTLAVQGVVTVETLIRWGLPVALGLQRFISGGDMSGLIDGETRGPGDTELDLSDPLLVFDTSAMSDSSPALGMMMALIGAFVQARWTLVPGPKILILEEAYNVDRLAGVASVLRALAKRGRASGTAVVTVLHHLSDLQEGSDLWTLIRETDVVHLFLQDKTDDAEQCVAMFGLDSSLLETLTSLHQGTHLLKVGRRPLEVVQQPRTALEEWITDTDAGMLAAPEAAPRFAVTEQEALDAAV
ncbi:MAG: hypothetical protein LBK54_06715 [Propionibacteriaceae bacterium]|jgi:ABC-type cobalamin/Fe3+-siderophores transport system ATPase subunit|nr:hypothetical protein [Propionibacteriaceae bacterium]